MNDNYWRPFFSLCGFMVVCDCMLSGSDHHYSHWASSCTQTMGHVYWLLCRRNVNCLLSFAYRVETEDSRANIIYSLFFSGRKPREENKGGHVLLLENETRA